MQKFRDHILFQGFVITQYFRTSRQSSRNNTIYTHYIHKNRDLCRSQLKIHKDRNFCMRINSDFWDHIHVCGLIWYNKIANFARELIVILWLYMYTYKHYFNAIFKLLTLGRLYINVKLLWLISMLWFMLWTYFFIKMPGLKYRQSMYFKSICFKFIAGIATMFLFKNVGHLYLTIVKCLE